MVFHSVACGSNSLKTSFNFGLSPTKLVYYTYGQKYSSGEKIFANFATCLHGRNFYSVNFCPVLMITQKIWWPSPHWQKNIYSSEYFYNARVAGIGKIFVQRKFLAIYSSYCVHWNQAAIKLIIFMTHILLLVNHWKQMKQYSNLRTVTIYWILQIVNYNTWHCYSTLTRIFTLNTADSVTRGPRILCAGCMDC